MNQLEDRPCISHFIIPEGITAIKHFPPKHPDEIQQLFAYLKWEKPPTEMGRQACQLMNDHEIEKISLACPHLEEVDLTNNQRVTDKIVGLLAKNCSQLHSLNLSCTRLSQSALQPLVETQASLEHLNIFGTKIQGDSLEAFLKMDLKLKTFVSNAYVTVKTLQSITAQHALERIHLTISKEIKPIDFLALVERIPSLKEAVLTIDAAELSQEGIAEIEQACKHLEKVVLLKKGKFAPGLETLWMEMKQKILSNKP